MEDKKEVTIVYKEYNDIIIVNYVAENRDIAENAMDLIMQAGNKAASDGITCSIAKIPSNYLIEVGLRYKEQISHVMNFTKFGETELDAAGYYLDNFCKHCDRFDEGYCWKFCNNILVNDGDSSCFQSTEFEFVYLDYKNAEESNEIATIELIHDKSEIQLSVEELVSALDNNNLLPCDITQTDNYNPKKWYLRS